MSIDFIGLLQNPSSKYFVVPLITGLLSIAAKVMSQNDQIKMKRPVELFNLSPNLLVSNFIFICCEFSKHPLITDLAEQSEFSTACMNALIFNIFMTIFIGFVIRKCGWDTKKKELKTWWGILIPDAAALFVMYVVFSTITL